MATITKIILRQLNKTKDTEIYPYVTMNQVRRNITIKTDKATNIVEIYNLLKRLDRLGIVDEKGGAWYIPN